MEQQQEQLAQNSSQTNTIRAEFKDTIVDDIEAFKAANPRGSFEDFVRWHSPRDWKPSAANESGELSLRMQGDNQVKRLFEETPGVPAVEQKGLFNAELSGEMALEFLRTASPLTVMQNLVVPFLGCCCYLVDACDACVARNRHVEAEAEALKVIAGKLSEEFEENVINEERLEAFATQLQKTEGIVSVVGALLKITDGDEAIVEALLDAEYAMDLSSQYAPNRGEFVRLVEKRLQDGSADSSVFEMYAESRRSSESDSLDDVTLPVGHRLRVEKNDQHVIVSSAISACDLCALFCVCSRHPTDPPFSDLQKRERASNSLKTLVLLLVQ